MSTTIIDETIIETTVAETAVNTIIAESVINTEVNETVIQTTMEENRIETELSEVIGIGGAFLLNDNTKIRISNLFPVVESENELLIKTN